MLIVTTNMPGKIRTPFREPPQSNLSLPRYSRQFALLARQCDKQEGGGVSSLDSQASTEHKHFALAGEIVTRGSGHDAEGATAPETLRQTDRKTY